MFEVHFSFRSWQPNLPPLAVFNLEASATQLRFSSAFSSFLSCSILLVAATSSDVGAARISDPQVSARVFLSALTADMSFPVSGIVTGHQNTRTLLRASGDKLRRRRATVTVFVYRNAYYRGKSTQIFDVTTDVARFVIVFAVQLTASVSPCCHACIRIFRRDTKYLNRRNIIKMI